MCALPLNPPNPDPQIENLTREFHAEVQRGEEPDVGDYLSRVPEQLRARLLEQLLQIEYRILQEDGRCKTVHDFQEQFPQYAEVIERVLLEGPTNNLWKFTLIRLLGEGGFGKVYLARDDLGRDVAIKVLDPEPGTTPALLARYEQELRIMGQLGDHPNIVSLLHQERLSSGRRLAVMQYVPGPTLRQHLESFLVRKALPPVVDVVRIMVGIANGVGHLQKGGLQAHRDLKPENIILDEGTRPRITDFGLAWLLREGRVPLPLNAGTPYYMAPEQVRHSQGNDHEDLHNCDIWAFGVILYECLTGQVPFIGDDREELDWNIEHATPVPPRRLRDDPAFNTTLEQICLKCLEKQPGERYSTAADLLDALQAWLDAYQGTPKLTKEIRDFTDVRKQYEHVTERKSVGEQINAFLATNPKGLLVIKGPPGKGKSAIAVDLEKRLTRAGGHRPVAFYFRYRTSDPEECVRHIYASLAIQHGISSPDTYQLPPEPAKALKALRLLLRDIGSRVDSERAQVIILDALDEAQPVGEGPNQFQVINELVGELPDHVYLIATSRAVSELATLECDVPHGEIDLDNPDYLPQYRRDVRDYLSRELSQRLGAELTEPLLEQVAQIADGNFLVARLICNELREQGGIVRDVTAVIEELLQEKGQDRLGQFYQRFVKRLWNHVHAGQYVGNVLRVLAFAKGDVTPTLIRAATGLQLEQWHTVREVLEEFLYIKAAEATGAHEELIRPFHASFRDYLRTRAYKGDERSAHRLFTTACAKWADYTDASRDYALRFAVVHAIGASEDETIARLTHDYAFLEAKANAGLIGSLKQDLDRVAERFRTQENPASGLVQDFANAIWESMGFIERHPSAFFQCMWNALWWMDSPEAVAWSSKANQPEIPLEESAAPGPLRSKFVEAWREWKDRRFPGFAWLRAITPCSRRPGECFFLQGHTAFISALEASADGLTALSASGDRSLRLWDVTTARQIGYRDDTEARIDVIRFCENVGSHGAFLGGNANGTLFLWDARSLAKIATVSAHGDGVSAIAVSNAGQWAVSAGCDGSLVVHELPTLRQLARWSAREHVTLDGGMARDQIYSVAADPQVKDVLFTVHTSIYRWNWQRNDCRKWLAGRDDGVCTLCDVSQDGHHIAIWRIELADPETPTHGDMLSMEVAEEIARLDEQCHHEELAERCVFSEGSSNISEIRFAPDGRAFAAADAGGSGVWYWEPPDQYRFIPVPTTTPCSPERNVRCVAFAARNFLLCGGGHHTIQGWNLDRVGCDMPEQHGSLLARLSKVSGFRPGPDFLLDPKGRYFILKDTLSSTNPGDASQFVLRIGSPRRPVSSLHDLPFASVPTTPNKAYVTCGAVSQNGARAVFALSSAQLLILDSPQESGAEARLVALPMLEAGPRTDEISLSLTDTALEAESQGDHTFERRLPQISNTIAAVAISHLGGIIAAATGDGRVTVWQDGPHLQWATSTRGVNVVTLAMASDETTVAVGDEDGSVTLLRISDGEILGRWQCDEDLSEQEHRRHVVFVHIDSAGESIACGFASGRLRWLLIKTGDWTTVGQVKYFEDFQHMVARESNQGYALRHIDNDIAVVSAATGQAVAWVPTGFDVLQTTVADLSASVIVARGSDSRFYLREGSG